MTNLQHRSNDVMYRLFTGLILCFLLVVEGADAAPNVLLIVSDDLNTDLSAYGHPQVKSPNLDALAKNGIRFDRTYAQYPLCTPSRSSFLTGLYPDQTEVHALKTDFRDTIPRAKSLPQIFRENGYHTARVGKIFHYQVPKGIGTNGLDDPYAWDEKVNPIGIDRTRYLETRYIHPEYNGGIYGGVLSWMDVGGGDSDHTDGMATDAAVNLLKKNHPEKTGKPFFLAVGYYRPHVPFAAPEKYFDLYPLDKIEVHEPDASDLDDIPVAALSNMPHEDSINLETRRKLYQAYYASVSYIDNEVGRLLASLDELDLDEETIVIFTSDHGFMLGEHGLWQKNNLFERSLHP